MKPAVQYLANEAGERTSVIISYEAWEKLRRDQQRLRQKVQIMQGIQAGFAEVKAAKSTGQDLPSLRDFLEADDAG